MSPWIKKYNLSHEEVAQILEDFLEKRGNPMAWDGFTLGMSFEDPFLEELRMRCVRLSEEFPPEKPGEYCNEQGRAVIRHYITELRSQ